MHDFVKARGIGAFGTRLRRLSERLDRDVRDLYRARSIDFEPSWYPLFAALDELGAMSVGEAATYIGVSHAAVSQIRGKLLAEGLITVKADAADLRRQMLHMTAKGRVLATRMRPLWRAIASATETMCEQSAPNMLRDLDAVEAALDNIGMRDRVRAAEANKVGGKKNVG